MSQYDYDVLVIGSGPRWAAGHELLGVHIIGEGASKLIHIGQAVLAFKGKLDYFVQTVFNYPTLAECYKTTAYDGGMNRLGITRLTNEERRRAS